MNNLETPYEEEALFIHCTICDKSIRGETLYKIHLTTPGHIKKEDALVASGGAVRHRHVPVFEDISQYLDYIKIDEPIIGLSYLQHLGSDPQTGVKYTCTLCRHNDATLQEMVHHLIGRKHRQRYVELKRPDLVTWTKENTASNGGKVLRTRAEIIERQDGRGTPLMLTEKKETVGKSNISRDIPRQKQNRGRNISQTQRDEPYSHLGRYPVTSFRPEVDCMMNRDTSMYQQEETLSHGLMEEEEELQRGDYRESDMFRPKYVDPDYCAQYEKEYVEDPQRSTVLGSGGGPSYDSKSTPHGEAEHAEYFSEEAPPYRKPHQERDALTEFYIEEVRRRGRVRSPEYLSSQPLYPGGDEQRWSLDQESGRHDGMNRSGSQGSSEPQVKRRRFPTPLETDRSSDDALFHIEDYNHEMRDPQVKSTRFPTTVGSDRSSDGLLFHVKDYNHEMREPPFKSTRFPTPAESDRSSDGHLFHIKDYNHEMREPHLEETFGNPGPSRSGAPTSQRRMEATRTMSEIPEPFRRFLEGGANYEEHGKRKRKSRFSDATAEELETTKEMFSEDYGRPHSSFDGHSRPVSAPLRPEIYETQHPDLLMESQSLHHSESYQRESPESGGLFDMLNNIEIENAEEADFLKNKLCHLLKEFKNKKSGRALQNSNGRAATSKDYNSFNPDPELSPRHQYDTTLREDSDCRQPEDHRGRGWQQHEHLPDEQLQEYHRPASREPRQSHRNRYEEVFGWPGASRSPHATHLDEPARYPEQLKEPMHPRDPERFLDSQSSSHPLYMERGPRMNRGPLYSNNLDKITSTLLELVARK